MTRHLRTALCALVVLTLASAACAQMLSSPGPQGTLTITSGAVATANPDWVELSLAMAGNGATAENALMVYSDSRDRAVAALVNHGVKRENIQLTPPTINAAASTPWMQQKGEDNKFTVSSSMIVRINDINPDTIYGDVCAIIDAASVGAAGAQAPVNLGNMMGAMSMISYGVDDVAALRNEAISLAIAQTWEVARVAAKESSKKLGDIIALQVLPESKGGMMAWTGMFTQMFGGPQHAGKATSSATVSVTFSIK